MNSTTFCQESRATSGSQEIITTGVSLGANRKEKTVLRVGLQSVQTVIYRVNTQLSMVRLSVPEMQKQMSSSWAH